MKSEAPPCPLLLGTEIGERALRWSVPPPSIQISGRAGEGQAQQRMTALRKRPPLSARASAASAAAAAARKASAPPRTMKRKRALAPTALREKLARGRQCAPATRTDALGASE